MSAVVIRCSRISASKQTKSRDGGAATAYRRLSSYAQLPVADPQAVYGEQPLPGKEIANLLRNSIGTGASLELNSLRYRASVGVLSQSVRPGALFSLGAKNSQ